MRNATLLSRIAGFLLLLCFSVQAAAQSDTLPRGIQVKSYLGWDGSVHLNSAGLQAVIVPAIGGRITEYSVNRENIIFEEPSSAGKTLANSKTDFWVGGYQCDIGPEIRGIPEHKHLWMGPHQWQSNRDFAVKFTSQPEPVVGIQIEKEIIMDPDTGDLGLTQTMKNVSDKEAGFCLWDRTLCRGGGFALFLLNKKSRFAAGWSIRNQVDGKYVYDGTNPHSPHVKVNKGVL